MVSDRAGDFLAPRWKVSRKSGKRPVGGVYGETPIFEPKSYSSTSFEPEAFMDEMPPNSPGPAPKEATLSTNRPV
jgi:hypothetical protein